MSRKPIVDDDMIAATVLEIPASAFTVLDFQIQFRQLFPDNWKHLLQRFGTYGEGRQYTVSNYLGLRIQQFSRKDQGILIRHTPWTENKHRDFRKPTPSEKNQTGARVLAVFRKLG